MSLLALLTKLGAHAHDRMVERAGLPPEHVDRIQRLVDALALDPGSYHLPIRHEGTLVGYAQFKSVPNRRAPVLATVLGPEMRPGGYNLEHVLASRGAA